jgi:hypothetical protein
MQLSHGSRREHRFTVHWCLLICCLATALVTESLLSNGSTCYNIFNYLQWSGNYMYHFYSVQKLGICLRKNVYLWVWYNPEFERRLFSQTLLIDLALQRMCSFLDRNVTDLINALPGNSSVNTVQHATIEEAVFSVSAVTSCSGGWRSRDMYFLWCVSVPCYISDRIRSVQGGVGSR